VLLRERLGGVGGQRIDGARDVPRIALVGQGAVDQVVADARNGARVGHGGSVPVALDREQVPGVELCGQ